MTKIAFCFIVLMSLLTGVIYFIVKKGRDTLSQSFDEASYRKEMQ